MHYHTPPAIVIQVGDERPVPLSPELRKEYLKLYDTQKQRPEFKSRIDKAVKQVLSGADRYRLVSELSSVPWPIIGVIHLMECNSDFTCHLHNGDPLTSKTKNVPKARPEKGQAPFTWEESALDALQYEKLDKWPDWGVSGTLYKLESYNGWGYRGRKIHTPYLWSGSTHYRRGKYVADGKWSSRAVSEQVGAAVILKALNDAGHIEFPKLPPPPCKVP